MISRENLSRFVQDSTKPDSETKEIGFDMGRYTSKHEFEVTQRKAWGSVPGGLIFKLAHCPFNKEHNGGSAAFTLVNGVPGFTCKHNGCHGKTMTDVFAAYPAEPPQRVEVADNWPDPMPLGGSLPPVERFDYDLLPVAFRGHVAEVAELMQVPPDFPAAATVICLAGAVGRRAIIQPKARDTSWTVVPNLWGGLVGRPGFKKSPVLDVITKPLAKIQAAWFAEHEAAVALHEQESELNELRIKAWQQQTTIAFKKGHSEPVRPSELTAPARCRRLIVGDATFEALHRAMSENPVGLLVQRDELTGWLAQLDKPGREGERAFCLEAWNGNSSFTIDRIERGTIHVPHVCMSLLGGIQPGRLRSYLTDALESGPGDDGLIQRFQVLVWPDLPPEWQNVDREPNQTEVDRTAMVYKRLIELPTDAPKLFRFGPDSQELFFEWYSELQTTVRSGSAPEAMTAHLSKYASLMPSLALLFELADQAANRIWSSGLVSLEHARQAAEWCDYLKSHAARVYSSVISPQLRSATVLGDRIKRGEVGADGEFTNRDIYRAGWTGLDSPAQVIAALSILAARDWVREKPVKPSGSRGGRPASPSYIVNPKVRRQG